MQRKSLWVLCMLAGMFQWQCGGDDPAGGGGSEGEGEGQVAGEGEGEGQEGEGEGQATGEGEGEGHQGEGEGQEGEGEGQATGEGEGEGQVIGEGEGEGQEGEGEGLVGEGEGEGEAVVVINEVLRKRDADGGDELEGWVELLNLGRGVGDLSGYLVKDNDDSHTYLIPAGTLIGPGEFLLLDCEDGDPGEHILPFHLGKTDQVRLFDPDFLLVDSTGWVDGQNSKNQSWGRFPDGTGDFFTMNTPSKGAPNVDPAL